MLLATARHRPTRSIRLATPRPPLVWRDLPLEQQQHVAHIVAVLVRRIRQQPQPESRSESLETLT
jgi:hypothetical protein